MVRKNFQSGQIALIALLVLMVATTVGLSLISRSTTDVSVTRNIEESNRAFSAAEAGIEEGLISGPTGISGMVDSTLGVKYNMVVNPVGNSANPFEFPQNTLKEDTETVWLVKHDDTTGKIIETAFYKNDTIDICWSSETTHPAIVVTVFYKTGTSYRVAKAAFDPDSRSNNFSPATAGGCTPNTAYKATINFPSLGINPDPDILIALRIRPVYSGARIAVSPTQALPSQGSIVESTGTSGTDVNRKIVAYKQYRAPASIFDYTVYSQGSFSQ